MKFQGMKIILPVLIAGFLVGCSFAPPQLVQKNNYFTFNLSKNHSLTDTHYILKRIKIRKNKYSTKINIRFLSNEIYRSVAYLANDFGSPFCLGDAYIQVTASPNENAHFDMVGKRSLTLGIFDLKRDKGIIEHELFHAFYQKKSALNNVLEAEGWAMYSQLRYTHPNMSNKNIYQRLINKYRISPQEIEVFDENARRSSEFYNRETRDYVINALPLFNTTHRKNLAEYRSTYKGMRASECRKMKRRNPTKNNNKNGTRTMLDYH